MYLIPRSKPLLIGGAAVLAIGAMAIVGLTHGGTPAPQSSDGSAASTSPAFPGNPEPVSRQFDSPAGPPVVYAVSPFTPTEPRAIATAPPAPVIEAPPMSEGYVEAGVAPASGVAARQRVYSSHRGRRRGRSWRRSVAIVGGSAAGGALIGGLAGGGKGAGIGAIAGGVGGLVYDRATAKK